MADEQHKSGCSKTVMLQLPKLATPVRLRSPAPFSIRGNRMKRFIFAAFVLTGILLCAGCSTERLPAEDLEVPVVCAEEIRILKNPDLQSNSREKYNAVKRLIKKVDLTFTRETKTINDIFYHGDAIIDSPQHQDRTISFNYQFKDHYVRIQFRTFRTFVLRVDITEK